MSMRCVARVLAMVLLIATAGCAGRANVSSDDTEWSMEGVIAAVEPGGGATRVTVDLSSGAEAEGGRAVLLVSAETEIEVQGADGATARGSAADLAPGARIAAQHTGAEMRSLPPQYQATRIRILSAR